MVSYAGPQQPYEARELSVFRGELRVHCVPSSTFRTDGCAAGLLADVELSGGVVDSFSRLPNDTF